MKKSILFIFLIIVLCVSCLEFDRVSPDTGSERKIEIAGPENSPFSTFSTPAKFKQAPRADSCYEGELADETKINVLNFINYIRGLHDLAPVEYNYEDDKYAQKGALLIAVNGALSHNPPETWRCWSEEGKRGCSMSNIIGGTTTPFTPCYAVRLWLIDEGEQTLGHRRWILNPFMKAVAYGYAAAGNRFGGTLKVVGPGEQQADVDFVAYPYHEYPELLCDLNWYLSFSVIRDRKSAWGNKEVDFTSAVITVKDEEGNKAGVTSVMRNKMGYGVPNLLAWKVRGLQKGVRYTVTIRNVKSKGEGKDYTYWFLIKSGNP